MDVYNCFMSFLNEAVPANRRQKVNLAAAVKGMCR